MSWKDRFKNLSGGSSSAPITEKIASGFRKVLPGEVMSSFPTTFEPVALLEWTGQALQRQGLGVYGKLITITLCAYFLSQVAALMVEKYIPEPPTVRQTYRPSMRKTHSLEEYNSIFARNLFNSKGLIPGEEPSGGQPVDNGPPQRTTLPFNLVGTVILKNELRSIATIEDKSASAVYPVRVDDEIPSKAKILKIEPTRVIFLNTASNRREFVDIPEEQNTAQISLNRPTASRGGGGGAGIEQTAPNSFNVSKTEIDKAFENLNQILTQARAVPNFENGVPNGYKLLEVDPNGFFAKLGFKNDDIITGVDGQPINDPAKAVELLGQLKTASHIEMTFKRGGKQQNFSYDIR